MDICGMEIDIDEDDLEITQGDVESELGTLPAIPALTGSDKQISWADEIRGALVSNVVIMAARLRVLGCDAIAFCDEDTYGALRSWLECHIAEPSASWWIDRRSTKSNDIIVAAWRARMAIANNQK